MAEVPVSGGEKFTAEMHRLAKVLAIPATLRVGFLEGATYPDGTSVAMIAAIQEYGAPNVRMPKWLLAKALAKMTPEQRQASTGRGGRGIPPRPYFRNMVAAKQAGWPGVLAAALRASNKDAMVALRLTGEHIRGELQQSIRDLSSPALSPITIALKGFDKPLIEHATMIGSVDYEVRL